MHLCISSKYIETFNEACRLIEMLLNSIVTEYKKYANKHRLNDKIIRFKKHDLTSNIGDDTPSHALGPTLNTNQK